MKTKMYALVWPRVVFMLIAIVTACTGQDCFGQETKVRAATFNCEWLIKSNIHVKFGYPRTLKGQDKTLWEQPGYRDGKFAEAVEAIADVIADVNADVLALIEIGKDDDFEALKQSIASRDVNYPYIELCKSSDPTGQHVALFSKYKLDDVSSTIPGRESYYKELDDADSEDDTGISKGLYAKLSAGNNSVYVYVVHLKSERGGHESDAQRIAQASIIRRNYLPHLKKGEHVIVMGDLNDGRGQPTLRRIRGFDDIEADLIQTGNEEYFDSNELGSRWTHEYKGIRYQIDHILISRSMKGACKRGKINASVQPITRKFSGIDEYISDHRPFILDLAFANN